MARSHGGSRSGGGDRRIFVEDGGVRRPFMRGIMTHSLMARGVSFEDAFRTANTVRDRIRGRESVTREELGREIQDVLGELALGEDSRVQSLPVDISVTGDGAPMPFSKGVLAQSLLAAAIDPQAAFDVARELERELRVQGLEKIDRQELRRLASQTLERSVGKAAAARYLVWRTFQESEKPVILLLGGAAGSGKTTLGQEVAYRLGVSRAISTDAIRQVMRLVLSPELMPLLHKSSYDAHVALPPDALDDDPVVAAFRAQASVVSVGARAMLDRAVAENTSLILDGVSVVPGLIDLEAYADSAHVIFLVVGILDAEAYRGRFASRGQHARARSQQRYLEHLDAILRIQDYVLEMADRHDIPIVDNDSFDRSVLSIIRHATETLRERGRFDAPELH